MNPLILQNEIVLANGMVIGCRVLTLMTVNLQTASAVLSCHGYSSLAKFQEDPISNKLYEEARTIDFSGFDPEGELATGVAALYVAQD